MSGHRELLTAVEIVTDCEDIIDVAGSGEFVGVFAVEPEALTVRCHG